MVEKSICRNNHHRCCHCAASPQHQPRKYGILVEAGLKNNLVLEYNGLAIRCENDSLLTDAYFYRKLLDITTNYSFKFIHTIQ